MADEQVQEENAKKEENKDVGGKEGFPIKTVVAILVLGVLIIAGGYYWWAQPAPQDEDGNGAPEFGQPAAKALFEAYEKRKLLENESYMFEYEEKLVDGGKATVVVKKEGEKRYVSAQRTLSKREVYWKEGEPNSTSVCDLTISQKRICAKIGNSSSLLDFVGGVKSLLPSPSPFAKKKDERLIEFGALKFLGEPKDIEIAGRACKLINYTIDYSNLTEEELSSIGMGKNDPVLAAFGEFEATKCFDEEYGISLKEELYYKYLPTGQNQNYSKTFAKFRTDEVEIEMPEINSGEQDLEKEFQIINEVVKQVSECEDEALNNFDRCLMLAAIDQEIVGLCNEAESEEGAQNCILNYALRTGDADACEQAGGKRDECYTNYAYNNEDKTYCTMVENEEMKLACLEALEQKNQSQNQSEELN